MSAQKLTVVVRDLSNRRHGYEDILIYTVDADPNDTDGVLDAVMDQRTDEVDDPELQLLFAFAGDLTQIQDWRE